MRNHVPDAVARDDDPSRARDEHRAAVGTFEVDAGDNLAVNEHEQTIAGEKVGKDGIFFRAGDDFVHGVDDGFKAREALNTIDDRGLRVIDGEGTAGDSRPGG